MPNMSYCRFNNTLSDLRDCYDNMEQHLPKSEDYDSEYVKRRKLIELCAKIANEYTDDEGKMLPVEDWEEPEED